MCVFLVLDIFRIHKQIMYAIRVEKNASIRKRLFFFVSLSLAETSKWIDSPVMSRTCVCLCSYIISSFFLLSKLPLSCIIFHLMIIIYKDRFILCFRFIFLIFFLSLFYREHLWLSLLRLTSPSLPVLSSQCLSSQMNTFKWQFLFSVSYHMFCFFGMTVDITQEKCETWTFGHSWMTTWCSV